MPELPDLEVFRINVFRRLTSKRLIALDVHNPKKVRGAKSTLLRELVGKELLRIDRVGKELFFDFGDTNVLAAHLMLSGAMSIVSAEEAAVIDHKIFSMDFQQETLVISDRGGLCTVKYKPPTEPTPDALDAAFTLQYLHRMVRVKPFTNAKAFLIDQHMVKGIGNAYADEILWHARISPHSLVGKIPTEQLAILHSAVRTVLESAIDEIKKISPNIISGEERSFLKVHNRFLKQTETGYPIIVEKIATKTTYHTKEQVLYA